jgi:hypothetical protein
MQVAARTSPQVVSRNWEWLQLSKDESGRILNIRRVLTRKFVVQRRLKSTSIRNIRQLCRKMTRRNLLQNARKIIPTLTPGAIHPTTKRWRHGRPLVDGSRCGSRSGSSPCSAACHFPGKTGLLQDYPRLEFSLGSQDADHSPLGPSGRYSSTVRT